MRISFLLLLFWFIFFNSYSQTDSSSVSKPAPRVYTHSDTVYFARLNSNANLMIAGGVGLCAAGGFLIYEGIKIYTAPTAPTPAGDEDKQRNHRQGTIYLAAASVGIAGGIILTAFGARNKIDFKTRKKMMNVQSGILKSGNLGIALSF